MFFLLRVAVSSTCTDKFTYLHLHLHLNFHFHFSFSVTVTVTVTVTLTLTFTYHFDSVCTFYISLSRVPSKEKGKRPGVACDREEKLDHATVALRNMTRRVPNVFDVFTKCRDRSRTGMTHHAALRRMQQELDELEQKAPRGLNVDLGGYSATLSYGSAMCSEEMASPCVHFTEDTLEPWCVELVRSSWRFFW